MSKVNHVGIDVGAKSLVVAWRLRSGRVKIVEYDNTAAGHRALCKRVAGKATRVCLEATGIYHLDVGLALQAADDVEVMVVNPRAAHNFAKAMMTRGKTDASDAEMLLSYVERMEWQAWHAPGPVRFEIRTLCRHTVSLRGQLAAERNRLARANATATISASIGEDIECGIKQLKERIDKLDAAALQLVASDEALQGEFDLVCSIPGVAATSAVQLLSELWVLPSDMSTRQWVAHAGLDPRQHQSGTSINKPPRISRAGNRYIRRALYMPALVAVRHSREVKAFYEQLVSRGKAKKQALVAVMRKLLHAMWGMLRAGAPWEGSRFYAMKSDAAEAAAAVAEVQPDSLALGLAGLSGHPSKEQRRAQASPPPSVCRPLRRSGCSSAVPYPPSGLGECI